MGSIYSIGSGSSKSSTSNANNTTSWKLFDSLSNVGFGNNTFQCQMTTELDFDEVRVHLIGNIPSSGVNYNMKCSLAVSETAVDLVNSVINGSTKTTAGDWLAVTVAGSSTITIPKTTVTDQVQIVSSDWMALSSIPRTDGGAFPILMIRFYTDATVLSQTRYGQGESSGITDYNALASGGRFLHGFFATGDAIAVPTLMAANGANFFGHAFAIEYRTRGICSSVALFGDSRLTVGLGTHQLRQFGTTSSESLSTAAKPITVFNHGFGGQTAINYDFNMQSWLARITPTAAAYLSYSVNDGVLSEALRLLSLKRCNNFIRLCLLNKIIPIIIAPFPVGLTAPTNIEMTKMQVSMDKMETAGISVFKPANSVGVYGTPGNGGTIYWNNLYSSDGTHQNDAGNVVLSASFATLLGKILV